MVGVALKVIDGEAKVTSTIVIRVDDDSIDAQTFMSRIAKQNPEVRVTTWNFINARGTRYGKAGWVFYFEVPLACVDILRERRGQLFYLMDHVNARFTEDFVAKPTVRFQ